MTIWNTLNKYLVKPVVALSWLELLLIVAFGLIFDFFWQYLVRLLVTLNSHLQEIFSSLNIQIKKRKLTKAKKAVKQLEQKVQEQKQPSRRHLRQLLKLRKKVFYLENFLEQVEKPFYPFVSIIIPCHNSEATLEKTLNHVLQLNYPKKEIIVVDDGSTDNTAAIAKKYAPPVNLVQRKVCSGRKTGAINFGLAFCRGDIVVVIDDDTFVAKEALNFLIKPLKQEKIAAVGANIQVYPTNTLLTKLQEIEYLTIMELSKPYQDFFYGTVLIISGAFGAFYKKYLAQIGEWDVDIITEDLDVTWKLYRLRKKIRYSQKAVCATEIPTKITQLIKQRSRWDYGLFETLAKHKQLLFSFKFPTIGFGLFLETLFFEVLSVFARPLYLVGLVLGGQNLYTAFLVIFYFYLALEGLTIFTAGLLSNKKRNCLKVIYAPLMLIYHQFLVVLRFRALYRFLTKKGVEW